MMTKLSPFSNDGRAYFQKKYAFEKKVRANAYRYWEFYSNVTYMWENCVTDLDWANIDNVYRPKDGNILTPTSIFSLTKM